MKTVSRQKGSKGESVARPPRQSTYVADKRHNKHTEVTAASYMRQAVAHRSCAVVHAGTARDRTVGFAERLMHRAVAITHRETAGILKNEGRRLRGMR